MSGTPEKAPFPEPVEACPERLQGRRRGPHLQILGNEEPKTAPFVCLAGAQDMLRQAQGRSEAPPYTA
jgi:hypothetical protein